MELTKYFDTRFKLPMHIAQCILMITGIIVAIVCIALPNSTTTRALIMALSMVRLYMLWEKHAAQANLLTTIRDSNLSPSLATSFSPSIRVDLRDGGTRK